MEAAVLMGLADGPFHGLTAYTEVIQDGMLDLLVSEKMRVASATAFFDEVRNDPKHPFRGEFDAMVLSFVDKLGTDPAYAELLEDIVRRLDNPCAIAQETVRRHWPFLRDRRIDAYSPILNRWLE